jgi:hypothetical protein
MGQGGTRHVEPQSSLQVLRSRASQTPSPQKQSLEQLMEVSPRPGSQIPLKLQTLGAQPISSSRLVEATTTPARLSLSSVMYSRYCESRVAPLGKPMAMRMPMLSTNYIATDLDSTATCWP